MTRASVRARWLLVALFAAYGVSLAFGRMTESPTVLHLTVILFHEAGHVLLAPFGEVLRVAGGTLGQLAMPAVCAVALARRGDRFGAALAWAWLSMSLVDASIYAYDAYDPVLPLIGGGTGADSFHDFVFLFDRFGQLGHARGWAMLMKAIGVLGLAAWLVVAAIRVNDRDADDAWTTDNAPDDHLAAARSAARDALLRRAADRRRGGLRVDDARRAAADRDAL